MRMFSLLLVTALCAGTLPMTGCDKTVEEHRKTTTDDQGNVIKHDETKKTVDDKGNVKVEEKHTETRP